GAVCAGLALLCCWAARGTRVFRTGVLAALALAWALPGPVLGLGLRELFRGPAWLPGGGLLRPLFFTGASALPLLWVDVVRFLPSGVAVLWPAMRLIPPERLDAARVDGAAPGAELRLVVWPAVAGACLRAGLAAGILSLGELSAGKLVSTPGFKSYAEQI